ncbi:hypothetical protein EDD21DRAFT_343526 [Dissophora ornata]|nr:hypothetical protein EDD21DRAFT_343526 [Dissophora ornata]
MDKSITGDKYIRTLSHYLRSNQRRLLPPTLASTPENTTSTATNPSSSWAATTNSVAVAAVANARPFVTPADPMAAAYQSMVSSLWDATASVVNTITPATLSLANDAKPLVPQRDPAQCSWDGTSTILPDSSPSEAQLYVKARLRSPIFPLDLYFLLYLLERFDQLGVDLDGWEGTATRTVGDSKPRVILPDPNSRNGMTTSTSYSSFPPSGAGPAGPRAGGASTRPQSIRSFSSTAVSTLTLITGWKQWSTAASFNSSNLTVTDDVHFIRKFMKNIPSLRLVSKIAPGSHIQGKGRIEGFEADAMLTLFSQGQSLQTNGQDSIAAAPLILLPLLAIFPSLTHLELHKIPPGSIGGWEILMKQLVSLVVIQSGIEDIHNVIVDAVVNSERRRRQKNSRETSRAVQIKEEQQEALKDAALTSQGLRDTEDEESNDATASQTEEGNTEEEEEEDDATVLASLKMWPALRHLSMSDNSFPALAHDDTFLYTQSITSLDLSHNLLLSPPSGLTHLHNLNDLNLSYNMISGVQSIYQILGNICVLDLRGNRLESLSGLERLWNLEKADVRENYLMEAAEVGRLAALPGIREVWAERNPFCERQPQYRLKILAVFKANGHDLLLDGSFASFIEKRSIANMSASSFSTTISSINNVANIPAASAPVATFAHDLAHQRHRSLSQSAADQALNATTKMSPGANPSQPIGKLVKKKLVKSSKRVKRVVNLDSDHEPGHESDTMDYDAQDGKTTHDDEVAAVTAKAYVNVLEPPVEIAVKKKKKKSNKSSSALEDLATSPVKGNSRVSVAGDGPSHNGDEKEVDKPLKKRAPRKKATEATNVSFAIDEKQQQQDTNVVVDHSLCHDDHHVHRHRLAHLEKSMASMKIERSNSMGPGGVGVQPRNPSRGILKKQTSMPTGAISPRMRPSSPMGSFSSDDGGADGYRRKIEAMRNEAGPNWLMVLAEMDGDSSMEQTSGMGN